MAGLKANKEAIFRSAFKTFLGADYGTVTIQDIEDGGNFTRGALFFYAKNKPAIFRLAMQIGLFDRMRNDSELVFFIKNPKTLAEWVYFYAEWIEQPVRIIMEAKECPKEDASRLFLRLLTAAGEVMPEFTERFKAMNEKVHDVFLAVIDRARKQGEVPPTTDIEQLTNEFMLTAWGCYVNAAVTQNGSFNLLYHLLCIYDNHKNMKK